MQRLSLQGLVLAVHSESWEHAAQVPPAQVPLEQVSLHVAGLPSSQGAVLLTCWQAPPAQLSFVQGLLSLHCESRVHAGQAGHGPPQSMPVSPWFWMPSEQVAQAVSVSLFGLSAAQLRKEGFHSPGFLVGANNAKEDDFTFLQTPPTLMV